MPTTSGSSYSRRAYGIPIALTEIFATNRRAARIMKESDIRKLYEAGLITEEQRAAIVQRYGLEGEGRRFLVILSIIGGIMVTAGIILLVSSNWDDIPHFVKLVCGVSLLCLAHWGGWKLGGDRGYPTASAALHLVGAGLFLANIGLVGQIYNLSSRPPNAVLLWCVGIAPLPWILRSRAQMILSLGAFGVWIFMEAENRDGFLFFGSVWRSFLCIALLGIFISGLGGLLTRSHFPEFAPTTEKFGLLIMHIATYPLTFRFVFESNSIKVGGWILCSGVSLLTLLVLGVNARRTDLISDRQWRWTWTGALLGVVALIWVGLFWQQSRDYGITRSLQPGLHWVAAPLLFILCVLQARLGVIRRSRWWVNVAVIFMGLHLISAYFELFGDMHSSGLVFCFGGLFLMGLTGYLERKRRSFLLNMPAHSTVD